MADDLPNNPLADLLELMVEMSQRPLNPDTIRDLGYSDARHLPGRGWCGLMKMMYTTGLFYGIAQCEHAGRYCYHTWLEAAEALRNWDGMGDPPGDWIKEKPSDRVGPGAKFDHLNERDKDKLEDEGKASA